MAGAIGLDEAGAVFVGLHQGFTGELLRPGAPGYDKARRLWNGMHDRRPLLIARCRDAHDVSAVLRHAVTHNIPVTVRGGGHSAPGTSVADGAIMIDLSLMRDVHVDPVAGVAQAGGGCLLRDLDAATTPYGLACPAGVVGHTGLGGLALGGGYGWLARKWGLTCDHIEAAEVVLADGSIVEVNSAQHPDLWWALRGGGGNFGVVTRFTLRLRPIGEVHHHVGVYSLDDSTRAIAAFREFAERQSRNLRTIGRFRYADQEDWIPRGLWGRPALFLIAAWYGAPEAGPAATNPLFDAVAPAGARVSVLTHTQLQALGSGEPPGNRYFTKSCYLSGITNDAGTEFVRSAAEMTSPTSFIEFEYLRGAIADVPDEESAFPRRDAPFIYTHLAQWTDAGEDDRHVAWVRRGIDRLGQWQHGGVYVNYVQDEPEGAVRELYGADRYRRLAALKERYDPGNLFRGNQNIFPASTGPLVTR